MRKLKRLWTSVLMVSSICGASVLSSGTTGYAAENTSEAQEIEALKARLAQLENRLAAYEKKEDLNDKKIEAQEKKTAEHDEKLRKQPKIRVEGDTYAIAEYHSTPYLSDGNSYTSQFRVRFISGTPQDKIFFYSEATTNFTSGESDHFMSGDSPYFSQAYFQFKDVLGLDAIRIGRSGGDCLGVGGPIDRPTNYDGIKLTKNFGPASLSVWTGNYTSKTNGDDPNEQNTLTTVQVGVNASKAVHASLGYWTNPHAFHNTTTGQYINANAGAGYDGQHGLDASLHWKIDKRFNLLTEVSRADLKHPTGGIKKHPVGIASMLYYTKAEMRPGLFPNIAELADWHQPKTWALGLIYGSNDAASGPYGIYNCADFSNGSIYGSGNNVNVLMLRGEYVFSEGVLGYVRIARAWIKDKALLDGTEHLGGDNYLGAGVKLFF